MEGPPADWNTEEFDDSAWFSGPSGIGYGDGDDATVLYGMQNNYVSVYARKTFFVESAVAVVELTATVDYDDGFVLPT